MKKRVFLASIAGILLVGLGLTGCGASEADDIENDAVYEQYQVYEEDSSVSLLNPIASVEEDTWEDYGTGDPYVMRYNGTYYLYMSTRDTHAGVKCFSSRNLVDWNYEGMCTEDLLTKGAYAPEVVYYNGMFYMYTSPAGNGHYVLSSDSPTGPFEIISGNLGCSIDGSVYIDNDGKWYFYHASDSGIKAREMAAPNDITSRTYDVNAKMNGWTEGPLVVQHDGKYFLTYTGNHVFSRGYRIDYGVGETPTKFQAAEENPILVNTLGDLYGIGHSSSVKGPDLDSYYIVYHSLVGRAKEGMPKRVMNIDRIVFNGERMDVLGPTTTEQQMPDMPDIYAYFQAEDELDKWEVSNAAIVNGALQLTNNGYAYSTAELRDRFTAEYNVSSADSQGSLGGYFNYQDEANYARFIVDITKQSVQVEVVEKGEANTVEFELMKSFDEPIDFSAIQAFQIEKRNDTYSIYFNDRYVGDFECNLSGGKIGYFVDGCTADFGFIGGVNASGGLSACTYEKPVPGTIQGIHYEDCSKEITEAEGYAGSLSVVTGAKENELDYKVRIVQTGAYDFSMLYAAAEDASYAIYLDGELVTGKEESLAATAGEYNTAVLRNINLTEGVHTLRIVLNGKDIALSQFALAIHEDVEEVSNAFDKKGNDFTYYDGKWKVTDGVLTLNEGAATSYGKRLYGSVNMGDYTASADITFVGNTVNSGMLVRASNPSLGGAGNDIVAGINFVQGYYVGMTRGELILAKMNFNYKELVAIPMHFEKNQTYNISVVADGNKISVSVDGEECIVYEDKVNPFLQGAAGFLVKNAPITVDNLEIHAITE